MMYLPHIPAYWCNRLLHGSHCWEDGASSLTQKRDSNHSSWTDGPHRWNSTDTLCSCPFRWLLSSHRGSGSRLARIKDENSTRCTAFQLTKITKETGPMKLQMK